jgi:hypothetical protein
VKKKERTPKIKGDKQPDESKQTNDDKYKLKKHPASKSVNSMSKESLDTTVTIAPEVVKSEMEKKKLRAKEMKKLPLLDKEAMKEHPVEQPLKKGEPVKTSKSIKDEALSK